MNQHDTSQHDDNVQQGEHEPLLDAEDAKEPEGDHEELEAHDGPRTQGEKLAGDVRRMAKEGAYAAAGFAGFVSEKAKEFYDEQRAQYQQSHPDAATEPGAKEFLAQMRDKLHEFVDGLTKGMQEMAERGRSQGQSESDAEPTNEDEAHVDDVTVGDLSDPAPAGDVPPEDAVVVEEVVPEGSEGDPEWPGTQRTDGL